MYNYSNRWKKPEPPKPKCFSKEQYEEIVPLAKKVFKYVFLDDIKAQNPDINVLDLMINDYVYNNFKGVHIQYKDMKSLCFIYKYDGNWYENNGNVEELVNNDEIKRLMKVLTEEYFKEVQ